MANWPILQREDKQSDLSLFTLFCLILERKMFKRPAHFESDSEGDDFGAGEFLRKSGPRSSPSSSAKPKTPKDVKEPKEQAAQSPDDDRPSRDIEADAKEIEDLRKQIAELKADISAKKSKIEKVKEEIKNTKFGREKLQKLSNAIFNHVSFHISRGKSISGFNTTQNLEEDTEDALRPIIYTLDRLRRTCQMDETNQSNATKGDDRIMGTGVYKIIQSDQEDVNEKDPSELKDDGTKAKS